MAQISEELLQLAARNVRFEFVSGGCTPVPYPWTTGWRALPTMVLAQFNCAINVERQESSQRVLPRHTIALAPGVPHNITLLARKGGVSNWCHLVCEVFHGVSLFDLIEPPFRLGAHRSAEMLAFIGNLNQIGLAMTSLDRLLQIQMRGWRLITTLLEGQSITAGRADFSRHLSRLGAILAFIEQNLAGAITHDLLARRAGLSRSRFHHVFRSAMGCAPYEYVRRLRLRRAQQLLLQSDLTIAQIADRVGHPDQFHFSRVFRRSLGMSPGQYRKRTSGQLLAAM